MIEELEVQDRLRRTYAEVASRTTLAPSPAPAVALSDAPSPAPRRRGPRRPQLALAGLVAIALVASGAVLVARRAPHRVEVTRPSASSEETTVTPPPSTLAPVPAAITGTEQTIAAAAAPSDVAVFFGPGKKQWHALDGAPPPGFSVNSGTSFVVDDMSAGPHTTLWQTLSGNQGACSFYDGTLLQGGQGYGIEISCVSIAEIEAGTKHAVFLFPDFPKRAQDTTAWSHLPPGTAFVTFTGAGIAPLWERPVNGVAAFTVDVSTSYTGDNYRSAPHPQLRAYDASGNPLGQLTSPYLVNFVTGSPGA